MTRSACKTDSQVRNVDRLTKRMVRRDPLLGPFAEAIRRRLALVDRAEKHLTGGRITIADFAAGHEYFGLHLRGRQWILREWAPNATRIYLIGEATGWREKKSFALTRMNSEGVWELKLAKNALKHGDLYRLKIHWRLEEASGACTSSQPWVPSWFSVISTDWS
jgi:1,4-alpha-glucan branching enzyme